MQVTTDMGDISPDILPSCDKCQKARVCSILRALVPLLNNWEEEIRPFEADKLAAICREFLPFPDKEVF